MSFCNLYIKKVDITVTILRIIYYFSLALPRSIFLKTDSLQKWITHLEIKLSYMTGILLTGAA